MELQEFRAVVEEARRVKPKLFLMSSPDAPARSDQLAGVEQRLGVVLPPTYRQFLQEYGGGDFGFVSIYSADEHSVWYLPFRAEEAWERDLPRDLVPFADDSTGGMYAFRRDTGQAGERVYYWDHETGRMEPTEFEDILEYLHRYAFEPA